MNKRFMSTAVIVSTLLWGVHVLAFDVTGTRGVDVGGAKWFFGADGASCDETCARVGGVYDLATRDYAGSNGTNANCEAVLTALGAFSGTTVVDSQAAGFGCGVQPGSSPSGSTTPSWKTPASFRDVDPTTPTRKAARSRRACACQLPFRRSP